MSVTCLQCREVEMKRAPRMTAEGFAHCRYDPPGSFVNLALPRTCSKFKPADLATVDGREAWYRKAFPRNALTIGNKP